MALNVVRSLTCSKTNRVRNCIHLLNIYQTSGITRNISSSLHNFKEELQMTLIKSNGDKIKGKFKEGDSILDVVVNNSIDLDGYGACEGTLTCSTCHVILKQEDFDKLPEKPTDEELDMLDLAYDLTETSRLGCQIILKKEMDGLEVKVPATINDARS